jgi:single-strand DNA-binding protein
MNRIILKGRISKELDLKVTPSGTNIVSTSIAVNRKIKNENGEYAADFFNLVAFGKLAEFINTYFTKGQEILIEGRLQNRTWEDQNGQKRYATDVIVESAEFCGTKKETQEEKGDAYEDPFTTVPDDDSSDLPF